MNNQMISEEIGKFIAQKMFELGKDIRLYVNDVRELFELSENASRGYIRKVINGAVYGTFAKGSGDGIYSIRFIRGLERLSKFLFSLGVDDKDPLIYKIKEFDRRFVYPPNEMRWYEKRNNLYELIDRLDERQIDSIMGHVNEILGDLERK